MISRDLASGSRWPEGGDTISRVKRWTVNILRWGANIFAGLSLLIFVAAVILWVRSYWREDFVRWISRDVEKDWAQKRDAETASSLGELWVHASRRIATPVQGQHWPAQAAST